MKATVILSEAKDLRACLQARRFLATLGMTCVTDAVDPCVTPVLVVVLNPEP